MKKVIQNSHSGKVWIQESISNGVSRADICSAYIRSEAFRYFFEDLFNAKIKIRVLARWSLGDLLAQASDLATYELCRSQNIDFYIKQDFHGKLYNLAPNGVLIGSFNLTNRGFSISREGNDEAGVLIENNDDSRDYFKNLFTNARLVDDEMFEKMSIFISEHKDSKLASDSWSAEIMDLIAAPASPLDEKILVNECLASNFQEFINSSTAARSHDLSLLSVDEKDATDMSVVRYRFKSSKIFRWFYEALRSQEDEVYFGKATAMLHDKLFDDPKPYRQEVKGLLVNLLTWIEGLGLDEIKIDRPNHSQRITVKKEGLKCQ
jgi:hypothetical protein